MNFQSKTLMVYLWLFHSPLAANALSNRVPKKDPGLSPSIRGGALEIINQPSTSRARHQHQLPSQLLSVPSDESNSNERTTCTTPTGLIKGNDEGAMESRRLFLGLLLATGVASTMIASPDDASAATDVADSGAASPPPSSVSHKVVDPVLATTEILSDATTAAAAVTSAIDWKAVFDKASKRALGGGKAGASAAVVQVFSLMWLRTSMNYQYRYGGNLVSSLKELWREGGIPRLYQGLPFALIQGPLTRFGDTAANVGILALLESTPETQALPLPVKTALGSITAGLWRIVLMPIDASKTAMQVEGADGLKNLWGLVNEERSLRPLYLGSLAQASATAAGHFPWFLTYNFVDTVVPAVSSSEDLFLSLARSAFLGLSASCVSDVCSNSLRVIKTTKQTARLGKKEDDLTSSSSTTSTTTATSKDISYGEIVKMIIDQDGIAGLFGRGLQTRLLTNSIQGAVFSVLWKYFQLQS